MKTAIYLALGLAALSLSGCSGNRLVAPKDRGICYHIGFPKDQKPKFNVVKRDVPSIEYCAAHLDTLRINFLRLGSPRKEVIGSYQGAFLFVDGRGVKVGQTYEGPRFQLLAKAPDGRLLVPGAFEQERPDFSDVQTLPDNLPQKK